MDAIPDLDGLKTEFEDQKKAFDQAEAQAKADAKKKVDDAVEAAFEGEKSAFEELTEDW